MMMNKFIIRSGGALPGPLPREGDRHGISGSLSLSNMRRTGSPHPVDGAPVYLALELRRGLRPVARRRNRFCSILLFFGSACDYWHIHIYRRAGSATDLFPLSSSSIFKAGTPDGATPSGEPAWPSAGRLSMESYLASAGGGGAFCSWCYIVGLFLRAPSGRSGRASAPVMAIFACRRLILLSIICARVGHPGNHHRALEAADAGVDVHWWGGGVQLGRDDRNRGKSRPGCPHRHFCSQGRYVMSSARRELGPVDEKEKKSGGSDNGQVEGQRRRMAKPATCSCCLPAAEAGRRRAGGRGGGHFCCGGDGGERATGSQCCRSGAAPAQRRGGRFFVGRARLAMNCSTHLPTTMSCNKRKEKNGGCLVM